MHTESWILVFDFDGWVACGTDLCMARQVLQGIAPRARRSPDGRTAAWGTASGTGTPRPGSATVSLSSGSTTTSSGGYFSRAVCVCSARCILGPGRGAVVTALSEIVSLLLPS
eukprot:481592-Rhodomonas_salina.1